MTARSKRAIRCIVLLCLAAALLAACQPVRSNVDMEDAASLETIKAGDSVGCLPLFMICPTTTSFHRGQGA
jgi:hypothetical protein